ncbi:unnamed protein product [Choristocarpus tenellus]
MSLATSQKGDTSIILHKNIECSRGKSNCTHFFLPYTRITLLLPLNMVDVALETEVAKAISQGKGWKEGERKAYLDRLSDEDHPLFADDVDPDMKKAFQDLTYEDETPESLAAHFKKLGNDRFARGKKNPIYFQHAQQAYSEGLRVVRSVIDGMGKHVTLIEEGQGWKEGGSSQGLSPDMMELMVALLSNRAAANLALKNYGSTRADCDEALQMSPGNLKCLYRKARAELLLRRYREALVVCKEGLTVDPGNTDLKKIEQECTNALDAASKKISAARRAGEARLEQLAAVWDTCEEKGIRLGSSGFIEGHHERRNQFLPEADGRGEVHWPVLLLYPEYGQSDLVQRFNGGDFFAEHLAQAFPEEGPPAPWDERFEYRCTQLVIYSHIAPVEPFPSVYEWVADYERMEAAKGGGVGDEENNEDREVLHGKARSESVDPTAGHWARLHPGCTLTRALSLNGHVVAGITPSFFVFPKDSEAHAEFLRERPAGRVFDVEP